MEHYKYDYKLKTRLKHRFMIFLHKLVNINTDVYINCPYYKDKEFDIMSNIEFNTYISRDLESIHNYVSRGGCDLLHAIRLLNTNIKNHIDNSKGRLQADWSMITSFIRDLYDDFSSISEKSYFTIIEIIEEHVDWNNVFNTKHRSITGDIMACAQLIKRNQVHPHLIIKNSLKEGGMPINHVFLENYCTSSPFNMYYLLSREMVNIKKSVMRARNQGYQFLDALTFIRPKYLSFDYIKTNKDKFIHAIDCAMDEGICTDEEKRNELIELIDVITINYKKQQHQNQNESCN